MAALTYEHVHDAAAVAARQLGYATMKYEQLEVVTSVLQGYDVFTILPTGFGKSLCFTCLPSLYDRLLPLVQPSIVIVVIP